MDDTEITNQAKQFARKNKKVFIEQFADLKQYFPTEDPFTFFMAGSPGAGKTEFSRNLIEDFTDKPVRIDADEIRKSFPGYVGTNAHLFQYPASIVVDDLYHHCLSNKLNVVVDGTFAYSKALDNIKDSLDRGRRVEIYFIYQEPKIAWEFTQAREGIEKRMIRKEDFTDSFLRAIENVGKAKMVYGTDIKLNLVIKDYKNVSEDFRFNIDRLDSYLKVSYSREDLESMLS